MRNVGFDVVEGTNLTRDKMTEKLLDFGKRAQGADVAVFFYAGHGIAISGTNYLLPVDADLKSEMDVKLGAAINVDLTLDQTMATPRSSWCSSMPAATIRSPPRSVATATRSVSVQSGLAEMKSGEGTLIAFATGPGQTALDGQEGTNSPFTRALIAHITQPGVEIQQAMTEVRAQVNEETNKGQLPWGHTNLIGSVYLNPAAAPAGQCRRAPVAPAAPAAVASTSPSDVELEFWRSVKESNKPEELNAYLTSYPNGQFKSLALARIASLENGPSTTTRNLTTAHRSRDLHRGSQPDHRRPDRPRQGPAPRRAAPPERARLRHQGDRQVRRSHPRRDQALAGRARLSRRPAISTSCSTRRCSARSSRPASLPPTTPTTTPCIIRITAAAVGAIIAAAAPACSSAHMMGGLFR